MFSFFKQKSVQIMVIVCIISGIGYFVKQATSKTNNQTITAESGSQVVTNNYNITENDSSGISLKAEVEHTVSGSNNGETTLITGISYKF